MLFVGCFMIIWGHRFLNTTFSRLLFSPPPPPNSNILLFIYVSIQNLHYPDCVNSIHHQNNSIPYLFHCVHSFSFSYFFGNNPQNSSYFPTLWTALYIIMLWNVTSQERVSDSRLALHWRPQYWTVCGTFFSGLEKQASWDERHSLGIPDPLQ